MSEGSTGLPNGWEFSKRTGADKDCIVFRHLDDFKYAEVRYEPQQGYLSGGYDYALYKVDVDGMSYGEELQGRHEDLSKAMRAGDRL